MRALAFAMTAGLAAILVSCGGGKPSAESGRVDRSSATGASGQDTAISKGTSKGTVSLPPVNEIPFQFPESYPLPEATVARADPRDALLIVVYKDEFYASHIEGNPGSHDQGYNTEVIRFSSPPETDSSAFRSGSVAQLRKEGERESKYLVLERARGFLRATVLNPNSKPDEYRISKEGNAVVVEFDKWKTIYSFDPNGDLSIAYETEGKRRPDEIWSARLGGVSVIANCDGKGNLAHGRYEGGIEHPTRYIQRPDNEPGGGEDLTIEMRSGPDGVWLKTDDVEPVNECLIVGLEEWFQGGNPLERLAIATIFLSSTRDLFPVFAAAVLAVRTAP